MIEYKIGFDNPNSHIINIEVLISDIKEKKISINLPTWRPGRYEQAHFAKNVYKIEAFDADDVPLNCIKTAKDSWEINTNGKKKIWIRYRYYAFQMDAGNSWLDIEQLYLNPINCLIYLKSRTDEKCMLTLEVPASYRIATGLKEIASSQFVAKDYFELVDCPIIASPTLNCLRYTIKEVEFYIWLQGDYSFDTEKLLHDFITFSHFQIQMMGGFPEKEFHFLLQLLPFSFRHGVEHRNSTVITIGPSHNVSSILYKDLLGISSHELFHCWNVLKIRPKEMLPYDFSQENYFKTGYIAEGFTTYYGDLILARAQVFTLEEYLAELNDLFKKHFDNEGNLNLSLADSSFDLWLDGYSQGTPNRKVSIYIKGAITAFLLDIFIRKSSKNTLSLDNVIKVFWDKYGAKGIGYTEQSLEKILIETFKIDAGKLIQEAVYGCSFLEPEIKEALDYLGLDLIKTAGQIALESHFGIKFSYQGNRYVVDSIHQQSPNYLVLSKNDEIIAIDDQKFDPLLPLVKDELTIKIYRGNKVLTERIQKADKIFYFNPYLMIKKNITPQQKENFNKWLVIDY